MRKLSALVTVVALVVAACGGTAGDTTTPPTATTTASVEITTTTTTTVEITTTTTTTSGGEREPTVEADATVTLGAEGCSSTIPKTWAEREMIVELVADTDATLHFAAGTYKEGYSREDLLALGTTLSMQPPSFVTLDYHRHHSTIISFLLGPIVRLDFDEPGRYYMVCFDDTDIDVVFPDVIVGG